MHRTSTLAHDAAGDSETAPRTTGSTSLLEVLWRRRWTLALSMALAVGLAAAYLSLATRIYRSSARLTVDLHSATVRGDAGQAALYSENFVQSQVDALRSAPVLSRALEVLAAHDLKTFADVRGDRVNWLRKSNALSVEAIKRADNLVVSMESPDPAEATRILAAVLDAYMLEQAEQRRQTGRSMVQALEKEKAQVDARSEQCRLRMNDHQRLHGIVSFQDNRTNEVLERASVLAQSVTNAQLASVELKARQQAVEKALQDPVSRSAFVSTELMKSRDGGDREYDDLRSLLVHSEIALSIARLAQASDNRVIQSHEARINTLREQINDKEMRLAEAHLLELATKIAAADAQIQELQTALGKQQKQAMDLVAVSGQHANFLAELDGLQKQSAALAERIVQVSVNNLRDGPLPVRVIEPPRAESKPVKPPKPMVLLAALLLGWVGGLGLVMLQERGDERVRDPDEAQGLVREAVLAMVPRINARLSVTHRGQVVALDRHSASAEAYRAVRTALRLGGECKTILVTSATAGEGKSTTASNLAIAFAQAGERTLLLDADLRRPVQHVIFAINGASGLADVLAGATDLGDAVRATTIANLHILPSGQSPPDPSELLGSTAFSVALRRLGQMFNRVIIDSPPLAPVADGQILAAVADATLLVLRMNQSQRYAVRRCCEALDRAGARVRGAVVNDVPAGIASRYYGGAWVYGAAAKSEILPAAPLPAAASPNGRRGLDERAGELELWPEAQ